MENSGNEMEQSLKIVHDPDYAQQSLLKFSMRFRSLQNHVLLFGIISNRVPF